MKTIERLSVFLPAYNEAENIATTVGKIQEVILTIAQDYEIIVVNDGSRDSTGEIVKTMARQNKNLRLINHSKNKGYGGAFATGLYACRYPWIVQMDSDGQFDFSQISRLLAKKDQVDLVIGYREKRSDSLYRRFMAKILWLADLLLFGINVIDVDCGFKLVKKTVVDKLPRLKTESAITVTEFIVRAKRAGFSLAQVPVSHFSRNKGEQTGGKPSIILKAAWQGIMLWFILLLEAVGIRK